MPTLLRLQTQIDQRAEAMRRWLHEAAHETPERIDSSVNTKSTLPIRPASSTSSTMHCRRCCTSTSPERASGTRGQTEGERRVRIYLDTFPLPQDD
ncbi:MAG: hypothetical protein M3519_04355 [Actinomycetota bacterium]|nr:hypothetical protein [Actinomycetota bacterium]